MWTITLRMLVNHHWCSVAKELHWLSIPETKTAAWLLWTPLTLWQPGLSLPRTILWTTPLTWRSTGELAGARSLAFEWRFRSLEITITISITIRFDMASVNELVSLTWLLWEPKRSTLHYIRLLCSSLESVYRKFIRRMDVEFRLKSIELVVICSKSVHYFLDNLDRNRVGLRIRSTELEIHFQLSFSRRLICLRGPG